MLRLSLIGTSKVLFAPEGGGSGAPDGGGGVASTPPASGAAPATPSPASGAGGPSNPSGAATPSPSSAGASAGTPTAEAQTTGGTPAEDPFSILGSDDGDEVVIPEEALQVSPVVGEGMVPEQPAPAVAPPVAAPSPTPAAPVPSGSGEPAQSPRLDPTDPGQLAELFRQNEVALVDAIANQHFGLSQQDVEAIQTDPATFFPKAAARIYIKAMTQTMNQMAAMVPAMIDRHMRVSEAARGNEDEFFRSWPQIGKEHKGLVLQYAKTYRQMNPSKPKADMIRELGPMVMMAAGIPMSAQATPASPVVAATNGVRPPQPSPFVPAVGGPAAAPQQTEDDPWGILGQDE